MNAMNYAILAVGLFVIGLFWYKICPSDRKREMKIVTIGMWLLGMIVYFLQSTYA